MRLAYAVLLVLAACPASNNNPDANPNDVIDATNQIFPDMRFKWVGSGIKLSTIASKTIAASTTGANDTYHDKTTILPMQVGGAGTWQYYNAGATIAIDPNDATVETGSDVNNDLQSSLAAGFVIQSLDLTSTGYAFSAAKGLGQANMTMTFKENETRAALAGDVATAAASSQVTTALAGPDGSMVVISEQKQSDTMTYDTSVLDATVSNLQAQAQTLASGGYVITACGLMSPTAIVLVGTKPTGSSNAHSIMYVTGAGQSVSIDSALAAGYYPVADVYDGSSAHVVLEK
jgi:hypothetical protein